MKCALCTSGDHRTPQEHNAWVRTEVIRIHELYPEPGSMPVRLAGYLRGIKRNFPLAAS